MEHQLFRHHAGFEDFAPRVDVADIEIDGFDALLEPGAQDVPLGRGENAHSIEPDVLDQDMTASDLVWALENLRFTRGRNALSALRIDRGVRDFLVGSASV